MTAGWIFTPDEGATSDVPDADYLHYGFWLQRTTDEDGVLTYDEVETFAGSSVRSQPATLLRLRAAQPIRAARRRVRARRDQVGWLSLVGHLRPLHGGRQPDGDIRADGG